MASMTGKFVWYDLMTTDTKAAEAFYGSVVGWEAKDSGMPGQAYTLFSTGGAPLAGLMGIPGEAQGMPPVWFGYIGVDDVDAYTQKVKAAGGAVQRTPQDIPGVGRFSVVADPQGAGFMLFTPAPGSERPTDGTMMTPGHIGWHELHAADGAEAFSFYQKLFGWTRVSEMDMGPMGVYAMFGTSGNEAVGGIMTKIPGAPFPPMWMYYLNVEAIDAALERVQQAGGQVTHGPHEVPGPMWVLQGLDPQGAMFALVAPQR